MISSSTQFKPTQYAPVRVNNPLSYYNLMEANVGDWFNDQSVIVWSRDNQAMRVVSDEKRSIPFLQSYTKRPKRRNSLISSSTLNPLQHVAQKTLT